MKRLFAIIMAAVMLFALTACGESDDSVGKANKDSANADINTETQSEEQNKVVADFDITDVVKHIEDALGDKLSIYEKKEDMNIQSVSYYAEDISTDFELDLTFDNISIKEGTSPKGLLDAGYNMDNEDQLVPANGGSELFFLQNPEKNTNIMFNLINNSSVDKAAKDCTVSGFLLTDSFEYVDYYGLSADSDLSDILEKFGVPVSITSVSVDYFFVNYDNYDDEEGLSTLTFMLTYDGRDSHIREISYV